MKKICLLCPRLINTGRAENICQDCLQKEYYSRKKVTIADLIMEKPSEWGKTKLDKDAKNDK